MASEKLLEEHQAAVKRIQEQVKYFHDNKKHFRVYHGSTSSTRPLSFQRDSIVDTSDMDRLFPVDLETMTVKAEPKVSNLFTRRHATTPPISHSTLACALMLTLRASHVRAHG